jgi:hypothetical protein
VVRTLPWLLVIITLLVLATVGCASTPSRSASVSTAASVATVCETTRPNGAIPPGEQPSANDYGNGRLYTILPPNGEIVLDPSGIKFPWWRTPGVGVAGDLKIEGHEITTGAAVRAVIPEGYGQRFQASGLYFPSAGCFEVTGRSGDASLTFVTKVSKVRSAAN